MFNPVIRTFVTPPGPAGEPQVKTVVEDVDSVTEAQMLMSLFSQLVDTDRVRTLYNRDSQVLILRCFVQP